MLGYLCLVLVALCLVPREAAASIWPTSHARIADALEKGDVSERRTAAAKLLQLPPKLGRALAKQALNDPDVEVRLAAARAAAALGVEGAGDEVVSWLQDPDVQLRVAAAELIEASPTEQSVQALARVLGDAKSEVRRAAASAMGASGMSEAVSPLLGHLDDGSPSVRLEVVRALGRIGDVRAVVPLVSRLQDQSSDVRRETARALGSLGDKRATATLMLALQDKSTAVRVQALDALGKLGSAESVTAIAALLSTSGIAPAGADLAQGPLHDAALRALGRIGTEEAVKLLIDALAQEGPVALDGAGQAPVRAALVTAGKNAVKGLLARLARSPSRKLASAIALTLAELGDASAVKPIVRATRRGTVALDHGLRALGALGDKRALPFVLEHIDASDSRIRQIVVGVATELLDPDDVDGRAVDVVKNRVVDLRAPIGERIALVRLLGETGSPRALPILLKLAETKPTSLRVAVIQALGTLGTSNGDVDAALLDALDGTSAKLRSAAAASLADVGKDGAAQALLHRLGVSAEQDRNAIGLALSGALSRSTKPELVKTVKEALSSSSGATRDALIEGLGRMQTDQARNLLVSLSSTTDVDDRRKVAEALGGHPKAASTLVALLGDPDAAVRANAAWSLTKTGGAAALPSLSKAVADLDIAVAGNAAAALARAAARAKRPTLAVKPLCAALGDFRGYVRAAALSGLRELGKTCPKPETVRRVLKRDKSWRARLAAARLLEARRKPGKAGELDRRALARCAAEDRDAGVAAQCAGRGAPLGSSKDTHDVMVYVVPDGKTSPSPGAPFALVLADGSMRLGVADRRGALFELGAPAGTISLAVPAALAK
jgi:HEAT repeat protein